jgi:hypothetical protein
MDRRQNAKKEKEGKKAYVKPVLMMQGKLTGIVSDSVT